jgi:hypothetical protein
LGILRRKKRKLRLQDVDVRRFEAAVALPESSRLTSIVPRRERIYILPDAGHQHVVLEILADTGQVLEIL